MFNFIFYSNLTVGELIQIMYFLNIVDKKENWNRTDNTCYTDTLKMHNLYLNCQIYRHWQCFKRFKKKSVC